MSLDDTPHHAGHRDRLKQRFLSGGADSMPDYEVLEIVLFQAIPRRDVKPLAKDLIARFGSLHGVVQAAPERLRDVAGMTDGAVVALKAIETVALRMLRHGVQDMPVLSSWDRLIGYCHAALSQCSEEQFRVLFLNKKNRLMADEAQVAGTVDQVSVYPREIIRRALDLGATALILVHNHPSGDPSPSNADIELTNAIIAAARPLQISVHDHLIIARSGHFSFKSLGLL